MNDWTGRELADEVKKQNIIASISTSRVNAFLRLVKLKPQHRKGWCFATDPGAKWIFVMDNLNTHDGDPVVRAVAKLLGVDQAELGDKKKRRGILGSTTSRRQFLSDPNHRIRFVFIPKHSSWLNQIEIILGVIAKRVMRHGSFTSKDDLREKLKSFIEYYNRTYAKPVNWTYDGTSRKTRKFQRPRTWREKTQNKKIEKLLALVA